MQFVVDIAGPVRFVMHQTATELSAYIMQPAGIQQEEIVDEIPVEEEPTYYDHNLFEIYGALLNNNIKIDVTEMNWQSLVALVRKHNIEVPDANYTLPEWDIDMGRYEECAIRIKETRFRIMEGDAFIAPDGIKYEVYTIYFKDDDVSVFYDDNEDEVMRDACQVTIFNTETEEETIMSGWDFVRTIACFDIKFTKSRWLKYVNKH